MKRAGFRPERGVGHILMRFFRHLFRLLKDFGLFAWHHKAWWILPLVVMLLLLSALIFVGQSAAPFIYTLF